MKTRTIAIALAGLALCIPFAHAATRTQAQLQAEARVSESAARTAALTKVPNGTVKRSELERVHRRLVWSFDIEKPGTKGLTEVLVDAQSGKIVSAKPETAAQEAKKLKHLGMATK